MTYPTYAEDAVDQGFPTLGVISVWFGVLIVVITAVGYSMSSPLGPSKTAPLVDMLQFILLALILASLFYVFFRAEQGLKVTAVPLVINIGTLVILQLVPFGLIWEEARFQYHWPDYQAVVARIESGEWQPDSSGVITLPTRYQTLSADNGRIWVHQKDTTLTIFFMTEQRGLGQVAGYLYRSDGRPPQGDAPFGPWRHVTPKQAKWFFCISG